MFGFSFDDHEFGMYVYINTPVMLYNNAHCVTFCSGSNETNIEESFFHQEPNIFSQNLQHVRFYKYKFTMVGFQILFENLPSIETLEFSHCEIPTCEFDQGVFANLKNFSIVSTRITQGGIDIAEISSLECFRFSNCLRAFDWGVLSFPQDLSYLDFDADNQNFDQQVSSFPKNLKRLEIKNIVKNNVPKLENLDKLTFLSVEGKDTFDMISIRVPISKVLHYLYVHPIIIQ
jgi:hypothetical protein